MELPKYQKHPELVFAKESGFTKVRSPDKFAIGDLMVNIFGQWIIGDLREDTDRRLKAVITCISKPINA